jgi:prepilin-type N-terminal cleavage/methylation domain-containing protein
MSRPAYRAGNGFTLIELLVVIGVIAVLIAILLPVLSKVRKQAIEVKCQSSLRQIHAGLQLYANDNNDRFPDPVSMGRFAYRMRPGSSTPGDPAAKPERYGLGAMLHGIDPNDANLSLPLPRARYLDGESDVWVCQGQPEYLRRHGNTYAVSLNATVLAGGSLRRGRAKETVTMVYENVALLPGLSGFMGPFSGYNIPSAKRVYPHRVKRPNGVRGAFYELKIGGHVVVNEVN